MSNLINRVVNIGGEEMTSFGSLTQVGTALTTTILDVAVWTQITVTSIFGPTSSGFSSPSNGVLERTGPTAFVPVVIGASHSAATGSRTFLTTIGEDSGGGFAPVDATLFFRRAGVATSSEIHFLYFGVVQAIQGNLYTGMVQNEDDGVDYRTQGYYFSMGTP